jgi:ribosomal protein L7/L12/sugar lactone lactonase YvrE
MPQSLKCPSCNAPLEVENEFASIIRCDFCNVSSNLNAFNAGQNFQMNFGGAGLLDQARKLKEIKHLALSGRAIHAIKLYRETFGGGLAEAKDAVDNIIDGKPVVFTDVQDFNVQTPFSGIGSTGEQSLKLGQIQSLIQRGNKIEAIKLYRETFGTGLKESKDAVDAMERGKSVGLPGSAQIKSTFGPNIDHRKARKSVFATGGSIIVFISIVIGLMIFGLLWFITSQIEKSAETPSTPFSDNSIVLPDQSAGAPQFAREVLKFGGEGTGAGLFKDNRTVAVDTEGRIYSADFSGGRIQAFDAQGNFRTQVMSDTTRTVDALAVDRKGNLYVLQGYDLFRFDLKNTDVSNKTRIHYASDVAVGLDGKVYVSARRSDKISVVSPEGKILRTISIANTGLKDIRNLAVDGAGNFYALDGNSFSIFKLSPEGKFLTRFGGKSSGSSQKNPPGLFSGRPDDIAIDPKGRVYVSQVSKISVFDSEGAFIEDFKTYQAFGMAFNNQGELFVATRPFITKYAVKQ